MSIKMDIDYILNGNRKPKQKPLVDLFSIKPKKQVRDPLMDLFRGQGHPMIGDRITKPQSRVLKSKKNLFSDWDRDGVINGLDCQPRNKKRHMAKIYHATKPYAINQIKKEGVLPSKDIHVNLDENTHYGGKYKDYSYWSLDKIAAEKYGPIVLSTEISDNEAAEGINLSKERQPFKELRVPGEVLVKGRIPPEKINIEKNEYTEEELEDD